MDKLEKIVEMLLLIDQHIDATTMPEVKDVLNQTTEQVRELAKSTVERILVDLEEAVTAGKITDTKQISQVKEYKKILDDLKRS